MINLLLIALEFPPIQAAGTFRPLRFATHLTKFGIRPIVVAYNPTQLNNHVHRLNPALAKNIPDDTPIYHLDVSAIEPSWQPFQQSGPGAYGGIPCGTFEELFSQIKRSFAIDAIWATCPPFNIGPLALAAKAAFDRPLVLDMRDAWSQWGVAPFRTWLHYCRVLRKERELMNAAEAVVCVTPQLAEMQWRLTRRPREHFHWIPNAYDFDDEPRGEIRLEPGKDRYRVGYVGQFYFNGQHEDATGRRPWYRKMPNRWLHYHATQQRWIYRTPYFFFRAWKTLRDKHPELKDRFEFQYVGPVPDWLSEMADEFDLADRCIWHGFKYKQESLDILERCDALLSTSIKVPDGEDYCLASKTFDYIGLRKPALGFVCRGTQRDFLKYANTSVLFDPDDAENGAERLRDLIESGVKLRINHDYLEKYSSVTTTKQLAEVVTRIVGISEKLRH